MSDVERVQALLRNMNAHDALVCASMALQMVLLRTSNQRGRVVQPALACVLRAMGEI